MDRSDLVALAAHRGYPMVSLVARTHRTSPDNRAEISKREVVQLLEHVEQAVSEIDWAHTLDGLAIFATGDGATVHYLPFPVESRVVVDETGLVLTPATDPTAPGVIDDAVDDLVERVLATGGDVVFTDGGLDDLQRIAASVRY